MKLAPLTEEELKFIRWYVWEPLRRNINYRSDYFGLLKQAWNLEESYLDQSAGDEFYKKWKLTYPIDPDAEFEDIISLERQPHPNPFEHYIENKSNFSSLFDSPAFVDPWNWITDKRFLNIWIDRRASNNKINAAIEKEIADWWHKMKSFYNPGIKRIKEAHPVIVKEDHGHHTHLLINLYAQKTLIDSEVKSIVSELRKAWTGEQLKDKKPFKPRWDEYFAIFDMVKDGFLFVNIAELLRKPEKTVQRQHQIAWEAIYSGEKYPTKRYRREKTSDNEAWFFCRRCEDKKCIYSEKPCSKVESYLAERDGPTFFLRSEEWLGVIAARKRNPYLPQGCKRKKIERLYEDYDETASYKRTWKSKNVAVVLTQTFRESYRRWRMPKQYRPIWLPWGDCIHCGSALCVIYTEEMKKYICLECLCDQDTGRHYKHFIPNTTRHRRTTFQQIFNPRHIEKEKQAAYSMEKITILPPK
jgi:hypothetical protein